MLMRIKIEVYLGKTLEEHCWIKIKILTLRYGNWVGLDPKAIKELKKLFIELKDRGCAVLISTHIIDTIKEVWDKILIMSKGKIVSTFLRDEVKDENEIEERYFAVTGGAQP